MKLYIAILSVLLTIVSGEVLTAAPPAKLNTLRKLKTTPAQTKKSHPSKPTIKFDTIAGIQAPVTLSGYDKPLASNVETALMVNKSNFTIHHAAITLTYTDLYGRMLHSRKIQVQAQCPPNSTCLVKWKSWDPQKSYYYHKSKKPRTDSATPYNVTCTVDTLFLQ